MANNLTLRVERVDFNAISKENQKNPKSLENEIRTENAQNALSMSKFKRQEVSFDMVNVYRSYKDILDNILSSIKKKDQAIKRQEKKIKKSGKKNKYDLEAEAILEMLFKERMLLEQMLEKANKNYFSAVGNLGFKESISLPTFKEEEESSASKMLDVLKNFSAKPDITVNNNMPSGSPGPPSNTGETIDVTSIQAKPTVKSDNPLDNFIQTISN